MRMYPKAKVSEKAERALKGGHPWVYAEEVLSVDGDYTNGGLVDVLMKLVDCLEKCLIYGHIRRFAD